MFRLKKVPDTIPYIQLTLHNLKLQMKHLFKRLQAKLTIEPTVWNVPSLKYLQNVEIYLEIQWQEAAPVVQDGEYVNLCVFAVKRPQNRQLYVWSDDIAE